MRELTMVEVLLVSGGHGERRTEKHCRKLGKLTDAVRDAEPNSRSNAVKAERKLEKFDENHPDLECPSESAG